jgi:hypothetical protein
LEFAVSEWYSTHVHLTTRKSALKLQEVVKALFSGILHRVASWKFVDLSDVLSIFVFKAMWQAVSISETSVDVYEATWLNILEDRHLPTRHRETLKSEI